MTYLQQATGNNRTDGTFSNGIDTLEPFVPAGSAPDLRIERLTGLVERVDHHNGETGFFRINIHSEKFGKVVAVGTYPHLFPGEHVDCFGKWVRDKVYGQQFRVTSLRTTTPTNMAGILKFLESGAIKGLGKTNARKLVRFFDTNILEVLTNEPDRLETVPGFSKKTASKIATSWREQEQTREAMIFLHGLGLAGGRSMRIYRKYKEDTVRLITENPYRLADEVKGIGFKIADEMAQRLGIDKNAMVRARAGICYILSEASSGSNSTGGHCGLPRDRLLSVAGKILEIDETILDKAIDYETLAGNLVRDNTRFGEAIFLARLHRAETETAKKLKSLLKGDLPWPRQDVDEWIALVETKIGFELSEDQRSAVHMVLNSKVSVITGNPGTGKTSMLRAVLLILSALNIRIALCAPTGRAAKRMSQTTGLPAMTIHRLLEVDHSAGGFKRNENNPLEYDLIVLDESSMVDLPMMSSLSKAIPEQSGFLIVGDVDQLPSIGPGQVLADIIASGTIPVTRLTKIFRQAESSQIIVNAHRINRGLMPEYAQNGEKSDFYFIPADSPDDAVKKIIEVTVNRIGPRFGFDPMKDIQILCPMKKGPAGTSAMNTHLQNALIPESTPFVERFGIRYKVGDRVLQTINNYDREVFNGDIGYIVSVDPAKKRIQVQFEETSSDYDYDGLDELVLAYAATIHKSQGSEFPVVIVPMLTSHYVMLQRNLFYTAITRGKGLVIVVGQKEAVEMAIKRNEANQRISRLYELLAA